MAQPSLRDFSWKSVLDRPTLVFQRLTSRRNARLLLLLLLILLGMIAASTVVFHYLMELEGQHHSWITGFYWTLTTMTTLGLGDVSFASDAGRIFTVIVLVGGVTFLLVILTFTFIQLFQSAARVPRELPPGTRGHLILTHYDPITKTLIDRLVRFRLPHVLVTPDLTDALHFMDRGIRVVLGDINDSETYRLLRLDDAAMVATTASDLRNTSIAYSVRHASRAIPLLATSTSDASDTVLGMAGCSHILKIDQLLGRSLARRILAGDALAHVIGQFEELSVAEAIAAGTPLVKQQLREAQLREHVGVTVVGVWERGVFHPAAPDLVITKQSVLVLAGTQEQIDRYNELFCIYNIASEPVLIIGGGKVGRAMGDALAEREVALRIVEREPGQPVNRELYVVGDATNPDVLTEAGLQAAPAVAITTHDDDTNVYVTALCRHLRPDIQIISRATYEQSIQTLYEAGCDFVMSYASMGANMIFNLLKRGDILMLAEGVDAFRVPVPPSLIGKRISDTTIRQETGCSILGVRAEGGMTVNPDPETVLNEGNDIVLLGSLEAENTFFRKFGE